MTADFIIGVIRSPFGISGKVKVESTSGEVEHFFKLTDVTLRKDEQAVPYTVESVESGTSCLLMKFKGIDSPEDAKKLSSWRIVVPRSMACPLNENEYYAEDLKGCTLLYWDTKGEKAEQKSEAGLPEKPVVAGVVTGILEGGAGDLLEVAVSESMDAGYTCTDKKNKAGVHKARTVLVPFKKEFIGTVDIEHGTIQLMHLWILE
ncbi:16S rRNA processing protein RimM [Treponema sp. OMZ 840]|uniref:ribosome maturation factor RimM n=1 Tax=Treponema sp. OMZ 840 TaxID=244313 RepID=UPI003D91D1DC